MNDDIEIETGTAGTGMKRKPMETAETGNAGVTRNQGADAAHPVVVRVPTDDDMRELGRRVALLLHGGDVLLLSGPLGRRQDDVRAGHRRRIGHNGTHRVADVHHRPRT